MGSSILTICGDYHFGDNPGVFQNATYIGYQLVLPLRKTWIDGNSAKVVFMFETHDIETWGNWDGHKVAINGTEIGRIKDSGNSAGQTETVAIELSRTEFLRLLGSTDNFNLSIELEKQPASPGLADDFVLTRVATSDSLALALGWK